jgi:predicted nuclease of predicted toxin-antitoxin system
LKIKLDENLPVTIAAELRRLGHDVDTVEDECLSGADDPVVLKAATADGRALVTLDKGLANVQIYPPSTHAGVILLRPASNGRGAVSRFVMERFPLLPDIDSNGRVIIVSSTAIRLR